MPLRLRTTLALAALAGLALVAVGLAAASSRSKAASPVSASLSDKAGMSGGGASVRISGSFHCSGKSRIQITVYVSQKATGVFGVGHFPDVKGLDHKGSTFKSRLKKARCGGTKSFTAAVASTKTRGNFKSGLASACVLAYTVSKAGTGDMASACRRIHIR